MLECKKHELLYRMNLTVITHTKFERPELLKRCQKSVDEALPLGAVHKIIHADSGEEWVKSRLKSALEHEYVCYVDDDDYLHPDSLKLCMRAIQEYGLAAACTDEVEVDSSGTVLRRSNGEKSYFAAAIHPRVIHRICVLRGDLVDPRVVEFNNRFGVGIDWFICQSVVQPHGCVYVPIDGYFWTQHSGQLTNLAQQRYNSQIREMSQLIRQTWPAQFSGLLPVLSI